MKVIVCDIVAEKKVYSELHIPYAAAAEDKVFLNSLHCKKNIQFSCFAAWYFACWSTDKPLLHAKVSGRKKKEFTINVNFLATISQNV